MTTRQLTEDEIVSTNKSSSRAKSRIGKEEAMVNKKASRVASRKRKRTVIEINSRTCLFRHKKEFFK